MILNVKTGVENWKITANFILRLKREWGNNILISSLDIRDLQCLHFTNPIQNVYKQSNDFWDSWIF